MMQTLPIAIRRAVREDAGALARIERSAVLAKQDLWPRATNWQKRLSEKGTFTYLAEDEYPFGYVTSGEVTEDYFKLSLTGEILGLVLQRDYRGRGLGKKLMVHGLSVIKRRGSERAIIWIPERADRAISMSLALGFERIEASRLYNIPHGEQVENCYQLNLVDYF